MSAAEELARRDARFRHRCFCDDHGWTGDCHGLGYIPLSGAALLLACAEWCKDSRYYVRELGWNSKNSWVCRLLKEGGDPRLHGHVAEKKDTAPEAAAAAVLAAMGKEGA